MARLKNEYDFVAGVYIGGELFFNRFIMNIDLYTNSEVMGDHTIGFERINYFMQDIVQRSIFISEEDINGITALSTANLPLLTVPDPGPYDQVIQAVIITKLNSILEDTLIITESSIMSSLGGFVSYMFDVDNADESDEIHDLVNINDNTKWWAKSIPNYVSGDSLPVTLTWRELQLHWVEDEDDDDVEIVFTPEFDVDAVDSTEAATIIKMSDFNKTNED